MCRIFAFSGDLGSETCARAVSEFGKLAQFGNVPHGIEPGHTDGWGVYARHGGKEVYVRSAGEATSEKLLTAVALLRGAGQALIHLRKATIGENKIENTHPFVREGVAFCHNGSIRSFPETSPQWLEGDTDSEKYFVTLLSHAQSRGAVDLSRGLEKTVAVFEKENWTSLTSLILAKDGIVLKYYWNESHPMTEAGKLNDYYTFFKGTGGGATVLCSEMLDVPGMSWESLKNGTLAVVPYA